MMVADAPAEARVAGLDAPVPTVGAQLAAARAAAGLTIDDIATRTRVPRRHLAAIEADAHDTLPALPYTLGFVKSFARSVGLDSLAVSDQFRRETTKAVHVPANASVFEPIEPRQMPSRGVLWGSGVALAAILFGGLAYSRFNRHAPDPAAPPIALVAPVATPGPAPMPGAVVTPGAPAAATQPVAPLPGGPIVLTAADQVWLRVTDTATRKSVFTGILAKGQSYTVPPGALTLRTGRAGALAVTVGGRAIPPLGGPAETVTVALTPEALLARAPPAA